MLREKVAGSMSYATTASLRASHDLMLRCHVLSDLEMIVDKPVTEDGTGQPILAALDRRLEVLGAYVSDKQYLLGVRRAAMELVRYVDFVLYLGHWLIVLDQNMGTKISPHFGFLRLGLRERRVRFISPSTRFSTPSNLVMLLLSLKTPGFYTRMAITARPSRFYSLQSIPTHLSTKASPQRLQLPANLRKCNATCSQREPTFFLRSGSTRQGKPMRVPYGRSTNKQRRRTLNGRRGTIISVGITKRSSSQRRHSKSTIRPTST